MVPTETVKTIRYKQQRFSCGQYVMFTVNPRQSLMIGEVALPRGSELWVVYKDEHKSLVGCPQQSLVYIRPATDKEIFISKLEGKI